ncbi:MAG: ABC transporter substrate-binding protein [Chloroflexota bacterium]
MCAALAVATLGALAGPGPVRAADPSPSPDPAAPTRTGPAAETIRYSAHPADRAPLDLAAGVIDLYLNGVQPDAMRSLAETPGVRLDVAPYLALSILLNPAPAADGGLNPFSIPEVRRAVGELVDRELVARDIYRGFALPQLSFLGPTSADYLAAFDAIRGSGIVHDPELARLRIAEAMTDAGATLENGRWAYAGRPIELSFAARTEDPRRRIADLVRAELERAGFRVAMQYLTYAPAADLVYATDPADLAWHLYTEGWGSGSSSRWATVAANQFVAPWYGNLPGWGEPGFWQYTNAEADEIGRRLQRGDFASQAERDGMLREMARIEQDEAVRIWVASVDSGYPATDAISGLTLDVRSGPRSPFALRGAAIPGRDDLNVGVLQVWNESSTWNPVDGLTDAFSRTIWGLLHDPALTSDPWSGRTIPYRAAHRVETAGPDGALPVPADAVAWDALADAWVPVPAGTTATSIVRYDYTRYIGAPWHDGSPITLADALYPIIQGSELVRDPVKAALEPAVAATRATTLDTIRGYRFPDDHTVEVYVDYWHFDENEIARFASPTSFSFPWQLLAATDALVFGQRGAAYSGTAASAAGVPWLSLVLARDAGLVDAAAATLAEGPVVPAGLAEVAGRVLVTPEDASARYAALRAFYAERRHLVDSSGPYRLVRFDTTAQYAELRAVRDPAYPMTPDDLRRDGLPTIEVGSPGTPSIAMGEAATIDIPVRAPGTIAARWLLIDPATRLAIASGESAPGAPAGTVRVELGAELTGNAFPGPYQLWVAVTSDAVALVTERRIDVDIEP